MKRSLPFFVMLAIVFACAACATRSTPRADAGVDAGNPDAGHDAGLHYDPSPGSLHYKAGAPAGNGYSYVSNGFEVPKAQGPATQVAPSTNMFLYGFCDGGSLACWSTITQDQIQPAFTVSVTVNSGGGTFEVNQVCAPTYNANPATNAGTVTGCTIQDNQGNGPRSVSQANPLTVNSDAGPGYQLTSPGSVTATVTETLISTGTTRSGSATGCTFDYRWFHGVDAASGGTGITASGNNATLNGGTATLTGALASSFVGLSFTDSPSTQYVYAAFPHTATAHTFHDQNGFVFAMSRVVSSYSFTNQYGLAGIAMDIYRSDNLLTVTYTVTVVSMLDADDVARDELFDVPIAREGVPRSEAA